MSVQLSSDARPVRWPWLEAVRENGQLWLYDPRRIAGPPVAVSHHELEAVNLFTGHLTLVQIHASLQDRYGTGIPALGSLVAFAERLDRELYLDG